MFCNINIYIGLFYSIINYYAFLFHVLKVVTIIKSNFKTYRKTVVKTC